MISLHKQSLCKTENELCLAFERDGMEPKRAKYRARKIIEARKRKGDTFRKLR